MPALPLVALAVALVIGGILLWSRRRPTRGALVALVAVAALGIALGAPAPAAVASVGAGDPCEIQPVGAPGAPQPGAPAPGAPAPEDPGPAVCTPEPDLVTHTSPLNFNDFTADNVVAPGHDQAAWTDGLLVGFDPAWLQRVEALGGAITATATVADRRVYPYYIDGNTIVEEEYVQQLSWRPATAGTIVAGGVAFPATAFESNQQNTQRQFESAHGFPPGKHSIWYASGDLSFDFDVTVAYSNGCEPRTLRFHSSSLSVYNIS